MKRKIKSAAIAIMAVIIMIAGCKKDDEKVLNKITIAGNSTAEYNKVYTPLAGVYTGPSDVQCITDKSATQIWITFTSDAELFIEVVLPSGDPDIPEGTFAPVTGECEDGFIGIFYPVSGRKVGGLALTSGTITIAKDGVSYDVDLDLGIHTETGGGTLKGNFRGPLPQGTTR